MEPVIKFDKVCFNYSDREVLHDISFAIEPQSFVGIVGPNGGGKTTLLRLALGLEQPQKGTVSVLGGRPHQARQHIGYVMQHMHFDDHFPVTVFDIALMGRSGKVVVGAYLKKDKELARAALKRVGMEGFEKRPFPKLSGGQRQRVLIAAALSSQPHLLLLDEPTANIDSEGETAVNELLNSLAKTITVIMVSHNVNTVLECADHVLCVNRTATMNTLKDMNPEMLARAKGGGIAVLHHELSCRIFDRCSGGGCTSDECDKVSEAQ
ncbi:MAG: metal ABC transporter ATP-binding protein [Chitinivibrionales bacterium]|nr:metal ABC transporter ATP-binding protein [Chitinivibrionales bacterium]